MTVAVRLDTHDPTPAYEQLRRQLATAIVSRSVAVGTRLPTVRQLAADLGIAPGTVMRTYSELEAGGLVVTRRGGGTIVADVAHAHSPGERQHLLASQAAIFVGQVRLPGITDEAIVEAVRRALGAHVVTSGPGLCAPESATSQD